MNKMLGLTKYKKLALLGLRYFKWLYIILIIITILSFLFMLYYQFQNEFSDTKRLIFIHISLLIKSILYYKIASSLLLLLKDNANVSKKWFERIGGAFFLLFLLDLISLVFGKFQNTPNKAAELFLQILPKGGTSYFLYEKVYLFIPAIYNFFLPRIEGISLLILAVTLSALAVRYDYRDFPPTEI